MKRVVSLMVAVCIAVGLSGAAFGAERATASEAEAMVKKAIAYVKANGKDKAFAEFNNTKGRFTSKDLYITAYDLNGRCLSHGQNEKMVGKDLMGLKDADNVYFIKERMEAAKSKGKGWQDYKFTNPLTKAIEQKTTYFEKYEDIVIAGGVYK